MKKITIIDGNSLLFRAYYATAYPGVTIMRTKDGIPTNAIFAFSNMINKLLNDLKPDEGFFVAFDTGHKTFRHEELETYKANRKPSPKELIEQLPLGRDLLKALGVYVFEMDGFEGDDIAGTVAKLASKDGLEVAVYTSDRDFLQLIDDHISIKIIKKGLSDILLMDERNVVETYGFTPKQIVDYKGLRGDSSDNLPGIPGIGEKTAVKLIQEYNSFENIVENAKNGNINGKIGESIITNESLGALCKHLAIIKTDLDLPFTVADTIYTGYDFGKISEFCQKYELKQFITKLSPKWKKVNPLEEKVLTKVIKDTSNIEFGDEISIALDMLEGNYHKEEINGLAICIGKDNYYLDKEDFIKDKNLLAALSNPCIKKTCYDYKAIKCALSNLGIKIDGCDFDILLASYLLDSSLNNHQDSVFALYGVNLATSEDEMNLFSSQDKDRTSRIAHFSMVLKERILKELEKNNSLELYRNIELPLASILADMEIEGFPLDTVTLNEIGNTFKIKLATITDHIYSLAHHEFNISSPKQVGEVLFDELKLPDHKKRSTSSDALLTIVDEHPIIAELLAYRKYAKLISTYTDSLINHVFPDGKIHTIFNQTMTTTGRLSSSEPNLQNISTRDEEGKLVRKAFHYPNDEYYILSLDYSQIELRILASLSSSPALIEVFNNDEDIHTATARKVFHIDNPSENQRRNAKAVNFGIVYGISDWGLSEQLSIPVKEAKAIIDSFYTAYPEVGEYLRSIVNDATKNGYVETLFGRRRYLREIKDSNYQTREFAKRAAMNAPIQGTAADLIKLAMIKVDDLIKKEKLKTKMVLQIHDELLFKVPEEEKDIVPELMKKAMENVLSLKVKLEVNGGLAKNWHEAK